MGITFGDHLIDSGYYDITPEQEREMSDEQEILKLALDLAEARAQIAAKDAALRAARVYVEMVVTDGYFNTDTEKEDLAAIDAALSAPAQETE